MERIMDRSKPETEIYSDESTTTEDQLSPIQEYMQDQNNCCLCGSELTFSQKIDHLSLTVVEDARCGSCHISLRTKNHTLH
jgi:hypothetical protein